MFPHGNVGKTKLCNEGEYLSFPRARPALLYNDQLAIVSTCQRWRILGFEYLFHCLYLRYPEWVNSLCAILDSSSSIATTVTSSYGWWTRRIHISRFYITPFYTEMAMARDCISTIKDNFENAHLSIIQRCPNLGVFIVEQPLKGALDHALKTYASRKLHTLHWNVTGDALSKVIWALDSLPCLIGAHIDIETPVPSDQECAMLGSASDLPSSPIQLATTLITSFHNRVFRAICEVGHAFFEKFCHQLWGQPI